MTVSVHFLHACFLTVRTRSVLADKFSGGRRDVASSRALWRGFLAHHEAWIPSELNQRKYCVACGVSAERVRQLASEVQGRATTDGALYRRGSISHALSHGLSHGLSHDLPGSGPIVPPAREVVVGGLAKQTNGRYFGGDAAGFALLRGSSAPWDRGTWSVPVEAGDKPAAAPLFATVEITSGFSG